VVRSYPTLIGSSVRMAHVQADRRPAVRIKPSLLAAEPDEAAIKDKESRPVGQLTEKSRWRRRARSPRAISRDAASTLSERRTALRRELLIALTRR
jgi:hypothetical protein